MKDWLDIKWRTHFTIDAVCITYVKCVYIISLLFYIVL